MELGSSAPLCVRGFGGAGWKDCGGRWLENSRGFEIGPVGREDGGPYERCASITLLFFVLSFSFPIFSLNAFGEEKE